MLTKVRIVKQISEEDIKAGQAVYTQFLLKIYDIFVVNLSNRWVWRCPKQYQLEQFKKYASDNHLDIGVGTGYYLKEHQWPSSTSLGLMDLNPECLASAKKATAHLSPETYQVDIFKEPPDFLKNHFDSVSINYLLHCLPGDMNSKSVAIQNAVAMLKPGATLFGSTILSEESLQTAASRLLINIYNKRKFFANQSDTLTSLKDALDSHLERVEIKTIGCVALFSGHRRQEAL